MIDVTKPIQIQAMAGTTAGWEDAEYVGPTDEENYIAVKKRSGRVSMYYRNGGWIRNKPAEPYKRWAVEYRYSSGITSLGTIFDSEARCKEAFEIAKAIKLYDCIAFRIVELREVSNES